MKKILLIFLCLIISLTFISCGRESVEKNEETSTSESNTFFSFMPSRTEENSKNDTELLYKGKKVKDIKFNSS